MLIVLLSLSVLLKGLRLCGFILTFGKSIFARTKTRAKPIFIGFFLHICYMLSKVKMLQGTTRTVTKEFVQFFNSSLNENPVGWNTWDGAICLFLPLHYVAIQNNYLLLTPNDGPTTKLSSAISKIKREEDGCRTLILLYMHRKTGLTKQFSFTVVNQLDQENMYFGWKDIHIDTNYVPNIMKIGEFVKNPQGKTVGEMYHLENIWKINTLATFGLKSYPNKQLEYIRSEMGKHQAGEDISFLARLGMVAKSNKKKIVSDRSYLQKVWKLDNSPLSYVVFHLHSSLVNYPSPFQLLRMPGSVQKSQAENGSRDLKVFYKCVESGYLQELRILEDNRRSNVIQVRFGTQDVTLNVADYTGRNTSAPDETNFWKLTGLVRTKLLHENVIIKFKEIIACYTCSEVEEKRDYFKTLLMEYKVWMGSNGIVERDLLEIDPSGTYFEEENFSRVLLARCILMEGRKVELANLKEAWNVKKRSAIHFFGFFIHFGFINHSSNTTLSRAKCTDYEDGTRRLEAEYKDGKTGSVVKNLLLIESAQHDLIGMKFGSKETFVVVGECVKGNVWKEDAENQWNLVSLNSKVGILMEEFHVPCCSNIERTIDLF